MAVLGPCNRSILMPTKSAVTALCRYRFAIVPLENPVFFLGEALSAAPRRAYDWSADGMILHLDSPPDPPASSRTLIRSPRCAVAVRGRSCLRLLLQRRHPAPARTAPAAPAANNATTPSANYNNKTPICVGNSTTSAGNSKPNANAADATRPTPRRRRRRIPSTAGSPNAPRHPPAGNAAASPGMPTPVPALSRPNN